MLEIHVKLEQLLLLFLLLLKHRFFIKLYSDTENWRYRNSSKYSDRQDSANSVDPEQVAPEGAVWSGSKLLAILSVIFICTGISVW